MSIWDGGAGGYAGAGDELRNQEQFAQQGLEKFLRQGRNQIGTLRGQENALLDPSNYLSHLLKGYKTSDYAKQLESEATQQGLGAAQQMGLGGSSAAQRNVAGMAGKIASEDQQNYLKNLLGIEGMGLDVGKGLYQGGLQAALGNAQLASQFASPLAGARYGQETASDDFMTKLLGAGIGAGVGGMFGGEGGALKGLLGGGGLF